MGSTSTPATAAPNSTTVIASEVQVAEYPTEKPAATVRDDAEECTATTMTPVMDTTTTTSLEAPVVDPTSKDSKKKKKTSFAVLGEGHTIPVELDIGDLVRMGGFHAWFGLRSVRCADGSHEWLLEPTNNGGTSSGTGTMNNGKTSSPGKPSKGGHGQRLGTSMSFGNNSSLTGGGSGHHDRRRSSGYDMVEALPPMIQSSRIEIVAPFETNLEAAEIQSPANNNSNDQMQKSPNKPKRGSFFQKSGTSKGTNDTATTTAVNGNQRQQQSHRKNGSSVSSIDFSRLNPFGGGGGANSAAAAAATAAGENNSNGEQHANNNNATVINPPNTTTKGERPEYVLKCLSSTTMQDPFLLEQGLNDMKLEAEMMRQLAHPRLKATGYMTLMVDNNKKRELPLLILERLSTTLDLRLEQWVSKQQKLSLVGMLATSRGRLKSWQYFQERLASVVHVCSALNHLHSQKIIYRNLKPENIGFDRHRNAQLMNFGLAKDLKSPNIERTSDGLYRLTGLTGNARYMPPEVALKQPYNEKCDVYSFALIMWQIMTLKTPYAKYKNVKKMYDMVFGAPHARPQLDGPDFQAPYVQWIPMLLDNIWSSDIHVRYSMHQILATLKMKQDELTQEYSSSANNSTNVNTKINTDGAGSASGSSSPAAAHQAK